MILFKRRNSDKEKQYDFSRFEGRFIVKAESVVWKRVDEKGVILNTKSAMYYDVEGVSLTIWEAIDGGIYFSELIEDIVREYSRSEKTVTRDIIEFLDLMKKEGIIELNKR